MEDPASVTIPSTTAKETTDHEFVTSATSTSVLNAIGSNATAETALNQSQDGPKDAVHHSTSNDTETIDRKSSDIFTFFQMNRNQSETIFNDALFRNQVNMTMLI